MTRDVNYAFSMDSVSGEEEKEEVPSPELYFSVQEFSYQASVVMRRLSYLTQTVLSNKITSNRIVLSSKDSPRKLLRLATYVLIYRDVKKGW